MNVNNYLSFAEGKKTYAVVAVGVVLGIVSGLHDLGLTTFTVPWYVFASLGFLGAGTMRSGVSKASENATVATVELITQVLADLQKTSPEDAAKAVAQRPSYKTATETQQTEALNESQLSKGN